MWYMLVALLLAAFASLASSQECAAVTFAKSAGYAPKVDTPQPVLYSAASGNAITAECYNRCKKTTECAGFILEYAKTKCYQVSKDSYYRSRQQLTPDPGVSFFTKLCLQVPSNCSRAWVVDLVPGYELVGLQHTIIPNIDDRWTCAAKCVSGNSSDPCYSANFNDRSRTCTLSARDRTSDRDSFIPTTKSDSDYIENHCIEEVGPKCWRDPVFNVSSVRIDTLYNRLSEDQCRERCLASSYYPCVAYSFLPGIESKCFLHSDASLLPAGPVLQPSLTPTRGALYVERIPCVNLTVTCDENVLKVTLYSPKFSGRLYVEGHSDRCGVDGQRRDVTVLNIPAGETAGDACGVRTARSLFPQGYNRTQYTAVVVVQHHPLIQTAGDRVVRVQCFLGDRGSTIPPPSNGTSNVTVGTQVIVATPPTQNEVTGYGDGGETTPGTNGPSPRADMSIVNPETGQPVSKIEIGDPLQLRITIRPPFNVSMVRAGHLVASSGASGGSSLLLLDWRGCPPDVTVFPNLLPEDSQTLVADFKAFKFPASPVLMLSVVLTFCPDVCKPSDCGNGVESYGRRRRSADVEGTTPMTPDSTTENGRGYEEMSLQVALVVTGSTPDHHGIIESSPLAPATPEEDPSIVCISFLMLALLAILWLLVQCIIMALFCWYLGKREKEHADTISLRRDFQPPSHHVTWADQQQSPPFRLTSTVI